MWFRSRSSDPSEPHQGPPQQRFIAHTISNPSMAIITAEPELPLTGFALFQSGRLLLQGGKGICTFCQPDMLSEHAFKQLLWLLEDSIGADRDALAQTDPGSIKSLLRVIVCLRIQHSQPPDPATGAVLAMSITPKSLSTNEQPFRGGICQPMVGLLPKPTLPPGICSPGMGRLVLFPETGRSSSA